MPKLVGAVMAMLVLKLVTLDSAFPGTPVAKRGGSGAVSRVPRRSAFHKPRKAMPALGGYGVTAGIASRVINRVAIVGEERKGKPGARVILLPGAAVNFKDIVWLEKGSFLQLAMKNGASSDSVVEASGHSIFDCSEPGRVRQFHGQLRIKNPSTMPFFVETPYLRARITGEAIVWLNADEGVTQLLSLSGHVEASHPQIKSEPTVVLPGHFVQAGKQLAHLQPSRPRPLDDSAVHFLTSFFEVDWDEIESEVLDREKLTPGFLATVRGSRGAISAGRAIAAVPTEALNDATPASQMKGWVQAKLLGKDVDVDDAGDEVDSLVVDRRGGKAGRGVASRTPHFEVLKTGKGLDSGSEKILRKLVK